jgi:hypothetical protein
MKRLRRSVHQENEPDRDCRNSETPPRRAAERQRCTTPPPEALHFEFEGHPPTARTRVCAAGKTRCNISIVHSRSPRDVMRHMSVGDDNPECRERDPTVRAGGRHGDYAAM